jgi:hypothetical protein
MHQKYHDALVSIEQKITILLHSNYA